MREIKFRAWDKQHKWMWDWAWCKNTYTLDWFENQELLKQVIMQFTGLKDKDRNDIFEGDLFNCIYHRDGHTDIREIVYDKQCTGFVLKRHGECSQLGVHQEVFDVARYRRIGNIYENPELLS